MKIILPEVTGCLDDCVCQICPTARQGRQSFSHSSIKTDRAFQMLHIDIWGPYKVKSVSGCTQFLTIVDDSTRFTCVHLLKFKSEVPSILEIFLTYVDNHFNSSVLYIRSANAMELSSGACAQLYKSKGIIHQTSCAYTPRQNGVVERKHRHLLEIARAIFIQSRLPPKFWGDSILCATYLLNRCL